MLQEFAARDEVRGVVLDLDGDSGLDQDYQQWDRHKSCAPAANIVAEAIHDLVGAYRHADPKALEYLTIVGSDAAVPFRRVPDHAAGMPENNHNPPVMDLSESRASFARGYVLTQDYYGSSSAVARQEHDMYVPGVAVGRAGESVEDIVALFDAYKASDGVSRPQAALASGYTFMQDLAELEAGQFEASGLLTDRLINNSWTAEDLRGLLSAHDGLTGSPYGILALNFHAAANGAVGGDYESDRPTIITPVGDIQGLAAHGGFANALILSIGCHFGYNIVDADAIPKLTDKIDFTQVFAAQGATLIGNTGYGYGDTLSVEYSERLLVNLTQQLRYLELNSSTPESVPIGKALVRAKRAYLDRAVTLTGLDEKAMEELTLYGLPMWKVALPDGRIRPAQASLQAAPPPVNPRALASVDVSPTYALALRQQATARAESSQVESYFANTSVALDHDVNPEPNDTQAVAFRPIVPRVAVNVGAEGLLARGVALLAADYDDRALFSPLVSVPVTESEGVRPSVTANEFAPDRPYALNALSQSLVVTPFQFRRRAKEPSGIARVYERDAETGAGSMLFRVYYSPMRDRAALVGPAAIVGVRLMGNDTRVRVDVTVAGAAVADLADVLLTYTAEPGPPQNSLYGHWRSCSLMPGSRALPGGNARCSLEGQPTDIAKTDTTFTRVYSAEIETAGTGARITDLRLFVQTVTGTGIVSTRTNEGAYFRVVQQTATLASPKIAISLALAQTLPATARFSSGVQVTAKLEDALGIPLGDKPVVLTLGGAHALTWTDPVSGEATAVLPANAPPGHEYSVTASFAEDVGHLESTDTRTMYIDQAGSAFSPCQVPCDLDKSTVVATLFAHPGTPEERPINEQLVRIEFGQCGTVATHTDGRGRVVLFERLACTAPGTVRLIYDGDDRYAGTELCFSDAFDATGCPSGEQHNAPPSARIIRR